jgi:hypothetical protein
MSELKAKLQRIKDGTEAWMIVGPYRRKETTRRVDILYIPKTTVERDPEDLFSDREVSAVDVETKALLRSGEWLRSEGGSFMDAKAGVQIALHRATKANWACMAVKLTGPKKFIVEIFSVAKGHGYRWLPEEGVFRKWRGRGPAVFRPETERELLEFLHLPWTEPDMRKYHSLYPAAMSSNEPVSPDEFRKMIGGALWIDSKAGGEPHQFAIRAAMPDDDRFLRCVNTIHQLGYDGTYLGHPYRYLDLDGWFYFTCSYRLEHTSLMNRKKLNRPDRAWVRNPVRMRLLNNDPRLT